MALAKTDGAIIRCLKFRETSLIVTFYTRDFGLLKTVAKGARGPKSGFRSSLDLFAYGQLVVYVKNDRDLQLLSDFDAARSFPGVQMDVGRFAYAGAAGELVEVLVAGQEPTPELLDLLIDFLGALESAPRDANAALFRSYQLKTCSILGYRPELDGCVVCGRRDRPKKFSPRLGGVVCPPCAADSFDAARLSDRGLEVLRALSRLPLGEVVSWFLGAADVEREAGPLLDAFLQYHVDRYKGLKSIQFLRKLTA